MAPRPGQNIWETLGFPSPACLQAGRPSSTGEDFSSPDPTPVRAWSLEYKAKIKIPHGTFIFACSATRARTWDILLTLIQKFLNGVDYIIARGGRKALRPD